MSKKKKSTNPPQQPSDLSVTAVGLLEKSKYKEAIEIYKQLLKQAQNPEWFTGLATAYLGRIREMIAQGLYKEAAALWENRAASCRCNDHYYEYLRCLFLAKYYTKAATLLLDPKTTLQEAEKRQLNEYLAAVLLTQDIPAVEAMLPTDSPLKLHRTLIKQAINAYCQGGDPREYLKQIPFRSSYRELRMILSAMYEGTEATLQIAPHSIYVEFVQLLKVNQQENKVVWAKIRQTSRDELELMGCLRGWSKEQVKLLSSLKNTDSLNLKQLFSLLVDNKTILGQEYSQKACRRILPYYIGGMKTYQQLFAPLSEIEQQHIQALNAQNEKKLSPAIRAWSALVNLLLGVKSKRNEVLFPEDISDDISPQHRYEAATIMRQIAKLYKGMEIDEDDDEDDEMEDVLDSNITELLSYSLRLDPTDKATYLELINQFSHGKDEKDYQSWVKLAAAQFPADVEILLLGVQAALANKAFKRAGDIAKTILRHDPINTKARKLLVFSHLSHARKQMRSGKYNVVRQELNQAEAAERVNQRSGLVQVNQGWLAVLEEQPSLARDYFNAAKQILKEPLALAVLLTVEGRIARLNQELIDSWVKQVTSFKKSEKLTVATIEQVVAALYQYHEQKLTDLAKLVKPFVDLLDKNSRHYSPSKPEQVHDLCKKLADLKLFDTLEVYAKQGIKLYPTDPLLLYYQVLGQIGDNPIRLIFDQELQHALGMAMDYADSQNNRQVKSLIIQLFKNADPF